MVVVSSGSYYKRGNPIMRGIPWGIGEVGKGGRGGEGRGGGRGTGEGVGLVTWPHTSIHQIINQFYLKRKELI